MQPQAKECQQRQGTDFPLGPLEGDTDWPASWFQPSDTNFRVLWVTPLCAGNPLRCSEEPSRCCNYQIKRSLCMVLYSLPVEGLIEGNMEDTWFCLLVCLFLPYVQSKSTLGVDEQLLKIAIAGDTSQLQPPPQTYSDSLASINSILWLCYQPPNLWVTKGNKLHASGKKKSAFYSSISWTRLLPNQGPDLLF